MGNNTIVKKYKNKLCFAYSELSTYFCHPRTVGFADYVVFMTATQLFCGHAEAATGNLQRTVQSCVTVKRHTSRQQGVL